MSDVISLARRVGHIEVSPQFTNYSKVLIHVDKETVIEAGNDTGRTLEFTNPFATQQMADDILAKLSGYQYQPYTAEDALLDPAAEMGDAASMRGAYGGIYKRERRYSENMAANIEAPYDEEIDHEYKYESPEERSFTRQIDDVKASLIIANGRIDATVAQTGGDNSTFGWSMDSTGHRWYANGTEVMAVTASGLTVKGNVQATTGKIGGFTIGASAIYNNISSFGGSQNTGVYVGTNGIQLGQNFKVSSNGSVTIGGTLNVGGANITAANLRTGAVGGNSYGEATKNNTTTYPTYFTARILNVKDTIQCQGSIQATTTLYAGGKATLNGGATLKGSVEITASSFKLGSTNISLKHVTISGTTINYLGA